MYLQMEESYMNRSFHFVGLSSNDFVYLIEIHRFAKYVQLHRLAQIRFRLDTPNLRLVLEFSANTLEKLWLLSQCHIQAQYKCHVYPAEAFVTEECLGDSLGDVHSRAHFPERLSGRSAQHMV